VRDAAQKIIDMNLAYMESGRSAARAEAERARGAMHWLAVLGIGVAGAIVVLAGSLVPASDPRAGAFRAADRRREPGGCPSPCARATRSAARRNLQPHAAQLRQFKRSDQQRLLRVQHTTQLAIDGLPDAVIIIDPRGRIELANQTARRLFALRPEMSVIDDMPRRGWRTCTRRRSRRPGRSSPPVTSPRSASTTRGKSAISSRARSDSE
jgi:PAS domain-containing protein